MRRTGRSPAREGKVELEKLLLGLLVLQERSGTAARPSATAATQGRLRSATLFAPPRASCELGRHVTPPCRLITFNPLYWYCVQIRLFRQTYRQALVATTAQLAATTLAICLALVASAAQPPVVRVAADAPVTIVGSGFREHEPVRVTIVMGNVMGTRRFAGDAVASAAGEFSVRFDGTRLDRCATPLVISAQGELTGLVTATLPARCAAP